VWRVEFVSDRMSYIVLEGRWCNIMVLNVHVPSEEKSDNLKDSFYEELEQVFDNFPRYPMKIRLGDFNAKGGGRVVSNRQLGKRVYIGLVIIMVLKL